MNQQELEKEYTEFSAKWADKAQEFVKDFNNLSSENKRKFQQFISVLFPGSIPDIVKFLNTKF